MTEQDKRKSPLVGVLITVIIIAIVVVWAVVKPKPVKPTSQEQVNRRDYNESVVEHPATKPLIGSTDDSGLLTGFQPGLREVIQMAKTWGPAFESWIGKPAPDFNLTDLTGKQHQLSDYLGKDVIVIFWATWGGSCRMEIPDLIELRNTISGDKLAMLAISNEGPALLEKFVAQRKINYTVFSNKEALPAPFSLVNSIPCSFFVDPEGKIKLATIGMMSLEEIKAILQVR
jgi:peroxiredoxin